MGRMRVNFLGRIENFSFEGETGVQEDGFVMDGARHAVEEGWPRGEKKTGTNGRT